MNTSYSIREVARRTGLSAHTLRYYEQIGLIDGPVRNAGGHRSYRAEDLAWITFLLRLRSTGMPVRHMQEYAALRRAGDTPESMAGRKALMQAHAFAVEQQIAALQENLAVLRDKIAHYKALEQPPAPSTSRP